MNHSRLQERKPFDLKRSLIASMFSVFMMAMACATVSLNAGIDRLGLHATATTLIGILSVFVLWHAWLFRPRTIVEKGMLSPGGFNFYECSWIHYAEPGKWFERLLAPRFLQLPRVRIIAGFSLRGRIFNNVGFSSEMECIWVGFLKLALGPPVNYKWPEQCD